MAEELLDEFLGSDFSTNSYQNTRDSVTGGYYPRDGADPSLLEEIRRDFLYNQIIAPLKGGRVYHDDEDTDTQFSVYALDILYKGSIVSVAAATAQALSGGNVTHYIYANPVSASIVVNTTGWPTTSHVPLATITLSSGAWAPAAKVDYRHRVAFGVVNEPNNGSLDQADHTSDSTLTAAQMNGNLHTNIGATALVTKTLPTPAAGLHAFFACMDTDGLKVKAAGGHTIQIGTSVTASAGFIKSIVIGSTLHLVGLSSTKWAVMGAAAGTWTVDA